MGLNKKSGFVCLIVSIVLGVFFYKLVPLLEIAANVGNGYGAHLACSIVFVANRSLASALNTEFWFPPIKFASKIVIDSEKRCAIADSRIWPWVNKSVACWKSRQLGCSLQYDGYHYNIPEALNMDSSFDMSDKSLPWPHGDTIDDKVQQRAQQGVNMNKIINAVQGHFNDVRLHARAFILIRDGQIIYEKYGDGCNMETPLLGWSMTKSVLNALIGIRIHQGELHLDQPVDLPQWPEGDKRRKVTIREMLRMSDGLDWDEFYEPGYDAPEMLFTSPEVLMTSRDLRRSPDSLPCFQYSSATANLLSNFLRISFERDELSNPHHRYLLFPFKHLFNVLGMKSAVFEADAGGTFIASSFLWAVARDWARFGLLYMNDGVWPLKPDQMSTQSIKTERLLPKGWVNFTSSETETSNGVYGAHFWLGGRPRQKHKQNSDCDKLYPSRLTPSREWLSKTFPNQTFLAHGYEEQALVMVPSKRVVMVRLGVTNHLINWDKEGFFKNILDSIPDSDPPRYSSPDGTG